MYYYHKNSTDTIPMLLLLLFSLTGALQFKAKAVPLPGSSCLESCGDVKIVYPFGIGAGCAMKGFELDCNKTQDGRTNETFLGNMPLLNISLLHGEIRVKHHMSSMCYNRSSGGIANRNGGMTLRSPPFTFLEQRNRFTVVGVNTLAYVIGDTNVLGCWARSENRTARDGFCDGNGCCQVALTSNMSGYHVYFNKQYNTTRYYTNGSTRDGAEYCGYAVMISGGSRID